MSQLKKEDEASGRAYPAQQPAYPIQQQAYPTQGQYADPPPPYQPQPVAQPNPANSQHRGSAPVCSVPQPSPAPGQPAQGVFDQGARFDPNKPITVPPPPPGVAPTAAQVAASQGQSVAMSQERKDSLGFGSDGGATFF